MRHSPSACLFFSLILAGCPDDPAQPEFGSLSISTSTAGYDLDLDGYTVSVDGGMDRPLGTNGTLTVADLPAGATTVTLSDVSANCVSQPEAAQVVTIVGGGTTELVYDIRCLPTNRIAFWASPTGSSHAEVFVSPSVGPAVTNLTVHSASDTGPAWSPDGGKIAFQSIRDGTWDVFVMNADGSNPVNLTASAFDDGYPAWSPDGSMIAFARTTAGERGIFVMDSSGAGPTRLTSNTTNFDLAPAWSPDGTKIAFVRSEPDGEIYVMDPDGTNLENLTNHPSFDFDPAWSPDGSELVFQTDRDGVYEIYRMSADGTGPTNISNNPGTDDYSAAWAPAPLIVFSSERDTPGGLYLMERDGSGVIPVITGLEYPSGADWSPRP